MTMKTSYREPLYIWTWLNTALKKEWQKYSATPVTPDLIPGHEAAQGWGYVVAGYSLIEQGLKAILHLRGQKKPPKTHSLSVLFAELANEDQDVLRAYYSDFRQTFPGMKSFPLATLEDFLVNLDGGRNDQGKFIGSFDWRYFPTEEGSGSPMPLVSVNVMHEVMYGCVQLILSIERGDRHASTSTYGWRLHRERSRRHRDWLTVRMNSPGWGEEGERLEILAGPDPSGRSDYIVFEGGQIRVFFAPLPKAEAIALPIVDKRPELDSFDPAAAFQSIGVTMDRTMRDQEPASRHIMY